MSQIQNPCLSKQALLPPLFFMGAAFLAGKYAIQYFPEASKEGLLMTAGLASTTSYLYDCALHDIDHGYLRTLLGKATAIAFATLCTGLAAQSLKGRANISWEAAGKFAAVELALAAVISYATGESALQKEHRHYHEYPYLWTNLSEEESTEKALMFMEAGLPGLLGGELNKSKFPDPQTREDYERLTPSELSWVSIAREAKNINQLIFISKLAQKKGMELPYPLIFILNKMHGGPIRDQLENKQHRETFYQDAEAVALCYQEVAKCPQLFYQLNHEIRQELSAHSEQFKALEVKANRPKVNTKLTPREIKTMPFISAHAWYERINNKNLWAEVPQETRSAFVKRMWCNGALDDALCKDVDTQWLSTLTPEEIAAFDDGEAMGSHSVMAANQEKVKQQLSPELLAAFNKCFAHYSLSQIQ